MKFYENKLIMWCIAVLLSIVMLFIMYLTAKAFVPKEINSIEIEKFNNCIVLGRVPITYHSDDMVVEKCLPIELLQEE